MSKVIAEQTRDSQPPTWPDLKGQPSVLLSSSPSPPSPPCLPPCPVSAPRARRTLPGDYTGLMDISTVHDQGLLSNVLMKAKDSVTIGICNV